MTPGGAPRHQPVRIAAIVVACGVLVLAGCTDEPDPVEPPSTSETSPSPTETPSPSVSLPLSPLEEDPAVQALRGYLEGYATAVNNGGDVNVPEVTRYIDPAYLPAATKLVADEVGLQYPGPVPFTPLKFVVEDETRRDVLICLYNGGYAVDPATDKPKTPLAVVPSVAVVERVGNAWLVKGVYTENLPETPDCSSVEIQEVHW